MSFNNSSHTQNNDAQARYAIAYYYQLHSTALDCYYQLALSSTRTNNFIIDFLINEGSRYTRDTNDARPKIPRSSDSFVGSSSLLNRALFSNKTRRSGHDVEYRRDTTLATRGRRCR